MEEGETVKKFYSFIFVNILYDFTAIYTLIKILKAKIKSVDFSILGI